MFPYRLTGLSGPTKKKRKPGGSTGRISPAFSPSWYFVSFCRPHRLCSIYTLWSHHINYPSWRAMDRVSRNDPWMRMFYFDYSLRNSLSFAPFLSGGFVFDHKILTLFSCTRCRRQKIKCSGTQPCDGCNKRKLTCIFDDRDQKILVTRGYDSEGSQSPG